MDKYRLQKYLDSFVLKRFIKIIKEDLEKEGIQLPKKIQNRTSYSIADLSELSLWHLSQAQSSNIAFQVSFNRVMTRFLSGDNIVKIIRKFNQLFPSLCPKLFLYSSPITFHWLVGPMVILSDTNAEILSCRYLREGGEIACIETCKKPTEVYYKNIIGIDLKLQPDFKKKSCSFCCKRMTKN